MDKIKAQRDIEQFFKKKVKKDSNIHNAYLLVHSAKHDFDIKLATGKEAISAQQPYYIASVSKLFTAVLFGQLIEQGVCSYDDNISRYLHADILTNLHIYKEKDYTNEIKIKHLLNNTSGLHDFLEDKPLKGKSMIELILDEPNRTWTPLEVIHWAKENMKTHFPPEKGFHYSDTGYHLLGLMIEKITGFPYHELLKKNIFEPLGMKHSHFNRTEPLEKSPFDVAKLYARDTEITNHQSMSIVFAGGGIVSTTGDLLKFLKALVHHQLLKKETIERMKSDTGRFTLGIDYGYGMMNIKTVPVLMPAKFNSWGNAGSTGSFMFYHPVTDAYIIGSLNHFGYGPKGIRLMLQILDKLQRAQRK
ncbi:serine hydrolase domain-containing protein [Bacillus sp. NPDC077027]|uniref:serine hydrolase domain-containing protein n=1 Tax=Bacillus sp. NPDC077027 TaxID=3390548 RepID=UPI003D012397